VSILQEGSPYYLTAPFVYLQHFCEKKWIFFSIYEHTNDE